MESTNLYIDEQINHSRLPAIQQKQRLRKTKKSFK